MMTIYDAGYHYYPAIDQVRDWLRAAGFSLVEEAIGDGYHHFIVRKLEEPAP